MPNSDTYVWGTELKWISNTNKDKYCVATVTEEGILQTKSLDSHICNCIFCYMRWTGDSALNPHKSTNTVLFKNKQSWLESLPNKGSDGILTIS